MTVTIVVYDRGPEPGAQLRYAAELSGFAALWECGATPWAAVNRLIGAHRGLLERRWSV